jgi:antitoxin component of RelBE/YafQ-DinJ toxin-antitoxin module
MVHITLDDDVASQLTSQAEALGLSLSDYLQRLAQAAPLPSEHAISADEAIALIESVSSASGSEYQGTYPRADIYLDHDSELLAR